MAAIRAVHATSIRGLAADHHDDDQIESWSEVDEDDYALPAEGFHVLVAEAAVEERGGGEGSVVAFGALDLESGEVRAVYVHPDHAGSGVGSTVLDELEGRAAAAGVTDLQLTATLNAVPFYERHGWVSTEPTTHELEDGLELEAQTMEKSLDVA